MSKRRYRIERADKIRQRAGAEVLGLLLLVVAGCAPSLHDTVARHDGDKVRAMLAAQPDLVAVRNDMGKTPLHYAVTYAAPEMVDLLIEKGAEINSGDNSGLTALHVAAMLGRLSEAEALVNHGANLEARDSFGDTPMHTAALFGQVRMVEFLAKAGADVGAGNNDNRTPLECARLQRKMRVVELIKSLQE